MSSNVITAELPVAQPRKLARIELLDVVRGFALLGIFLMNIEYFNRPFAEFGLGIPSDTVGWDYVVANLTEIFVTGKFWVLFSLLFGMGFVLMQTQAEIDGRPFNRIYLRRTSALLVFGVLHGILFWPGDILHSYALVAFVFMWLPPMRIRSSVIVGLLLYLAPSYLVLMAEVFMGAVSSDLQSMALESSSLAMQARQASDTYLHGNFMQVVQQHWLDFQFILNLEPFIFIEALGIFLLGSSIMRSGRLLDLAGNRSFFLKALSVCVLLAIIFIGAAHISGTDGPIGGSLMEMGNLPLSLCYFCAIASAMSFVVPAKMLGLLAPAGKMALSNYILQSLIASTTFYGYGLGLWGHWGRADLALFVVLVFIVQIVVSRFWLRYFHFGPMEWCWRALTYWTLPAMRIKAGERSRH